MTDNSVLFESPVKHIQWRIKNFFDQPTENYYKLQSPYFSLLDAEWYIKISTSGTNEDSFGYIGYYLYRKASVMEHRVSCTIGIKHTNGSDLEARTLDHTFSDETESGYGYSKCMLRSKLLSLKDDVAPDGTLTVFCALRLEDKLFASSTIESASQTLSEGIPALIEDLKNLFLSGRHADVTIAVENKEFRAHRNILSSRSSVFESMFLHDMEEKNEGRVEIRDCDQDTFKDFLLFLYTGKCNSASCSNAMSLYRTSDKYDVKELKDECVRYMIDELSDDVFCDVLHLATMQNEKDLLKAVTDYFINNAKTIILTTKWQTFLAEHPILGNELFSKLINLKDNIK